MLLSQFIVGGFFLILFMLPSQAQAGCNTDGCPEGMTCIRVYDATENTTTNIFRCEVDRGFVGPPGPVNHCGNRCAVSDCINVNGGNGWVCRSEMTGGGGGCAEYQQLQEQCSAQITDTAYTCDEKNDSGMSGVANTASQLSLMFGQQTAASIQAACSKMASLSAAANAAVAAYRLTCSSSINSCHSACGALVEWVNRNPTCVQASGGSISISSAESQAKRCSDFENKVQEANQAIANFGNTMQNASQCASLTSGDSTPIPEICKTNPNLPGCSAAGPVDCTKPEMASNKVCICAKSPTDPVCLNTKSGGGTFVGSSLDSSSRLTAKGGDGLSGDLPGLPSISPGKPGSGGAGEAVDGKQGGGAGLAGGGGGSGGGGDSGGGSGGDGEGLDGVQVTAGFYGGGGGSFGSYGGGAAGGGGRPGAGAAGTATTKGGPDLSKFLPGGQYDPKRGISGMGGADGITGPHSNIWQKIQNRYRVMTPTLLP